MDLIAHLTAVGRIARRRDLVAAGFVDRELTSAVRAGRILRVRHGWYATTDTAELLRQAVRVGGRLTGVSALRARGLFLPRPDRIHLSVPRNAARLRSRHDRRVRLNPRGGVRVHWSEPSGRSRVPSDWIASDEEALEVVLRTEGREIAVAVCDGLIRYRGWTAARVAEVVARGPRRVRGWATLVDGRADAWGESVVRLRLGDAGIRFAPQVAVPGCGAFDGRVAARVFVEVDGAQHDEEWTGADPSSFERDHEKDLALAAWGGRVVRVTYRQLVGDWEAVLGSIRRAVEDDRAARGRRKRRRMPRRAVAREPQLGASPFDPSFSTGRPPGPPSPAA
jgi:very-short-patch-repair endonuclease